MGKKFKYCNLCVFLRVGVGEGDISVKGGVWASYCSILSAGCVQ